MVLRRDHLTTPMRLLLSIAHVRHVCGISFCTSRPRTPTLIAAVAAFKSSFLPWPAEHNLKSITKSAVSVFVLVAVAQCTGERKVFLDVVISLNDVELFSSINQDMYYQFEFLRKGKSVLPTSSAVD